MGIRLDNSPLEKSQENAASLPVFCLLMKQLEPQVILLQEPEVQVVKEVTMQQ